MAGATFVQSAYGWQIGGSSTSLPVLSSAVAAGDQIIVIVEAVNGQGTCTGVIDSAGNSYTLQTTQTPAAQHIIQFWLATNIVAQSSLTITPSKNVPGAYLLTTVLDYNAGAPFVFDNAVNATSNSTATPSVGPTATTAI